MFAFALKHARASACSRLNGSGLLDELTLMVHPVVVGSGMRLFDGITDQVHLKLVESATLSTGVLSVTYQPSSG
jgi:dihydrofolate reductase